jgi:SAM-dependent methyltransferase
MQPEQPVPSGHHSADLPRILDVGCGPDKLDGALGLDVIEQPGIDLVHNLDVHPWPLPDQHFEHVRAKDVLEHVDDFIGAVQQIHRILAPGGTLSIRMPFANSVHHHTDPTHKRAATSRTMDYFVPGTHLGRYGYSDAAFQLDSFRYHREMVVPKGWKGLVRWWDSKLLRFLERHHDTYEHYWMGIFPVHSIEFELTRSEQPTPEADA